MKLEKDFRREEIPQEYAFLDIFGLPTFLHLDGYLEVMFDNPHKIPNKPILTLEALELGDGRLHIPKLSPTPFVINRDNHSLEGFLKQKSPLYNPRVITSRIRTQREMEEALMKIPHTTFIGNPTMSLESQMRFFEEIYQKRIDELYSNQATFGYHYLGPELVD